MEGVEFVLPQVKEDKIKTIKETINATFKELSLLADDLIEQAKKETTTREEYIAYMKGAAFVFYRVCRQDDRPLTGTGSTVSTVQEAIEHCKDLFPFLTEEEKEEHLQLMNWLNELLEKRGEPRISISINL